MNKSCLVYSISNAWSGGSWTVSGVAGLLAAYPAAFHAVQWLGAVYLGGVTFAQLWQAGRAVERRPGGVHRADALFRTERAPWCPERF